MKTGLSYLADIHNLSFSDIGEKLGVSRQQISMWAGGKRSIPSKWLKPLAGIFKVNPELLEKDLSQTDYLNLQIKYLKENDREYEVPFFNDEGEELGSTFRSENESIVMHLQSEVGKLEKLDSIQKMSNEIFLKEMEEGKGSNIEIKMDSDLKILLSLIDILNKDETSKGKLLLRVFSQLIVLNQVKASDDWDVLVGFYSPEEFLNVIPGSFEKELISLLIKYGFITDDTLKNYIK